MAYQTEFVLRNDGFWYAPPMDSVEELDFTLDYQKHLGDDTIENLTSVTATGITVSLTDFAAQTVTVWLKNGILRSIASVTVVIVTVGGRTISRTFKIEITKQ